MVRQTSFRPDQVHSSVFIASGAVVLGDVILRSGASVWFQAVLRGDTERLDIGPDCNIQDGSVLHADPGFPCELAAGVTIGHRCVIHGCRLHENVLIGMGSVVLNGAVVGADSLVGACALVPSGMEVPPGSLVLGVPGRVIRPLTPEEIEGNRQTARHYVQAAQDYLANQA